MELLDVKMLPQRKHPRLTGYDYSQNGAYFLTVCTKNRCKILSEIGITASTLEEHHGVCLLPYGVVAESVILHMDRIYAHISVDKYVIMPDHIHFLIAIHGDYKENVEGTSEIARFIGTFKRFCNREYGRNIWQRGYFDHVIRNQMDYDQTWQYIDNNPQKWALQKRGYE